MDFKKNLESFGWPRLIIAIFLFMMLATTPFVGLNIYTSVSDIFIRFGMNGVMVLAMVPMIRSGCGPNFGLSLGFLAGILGALLSVEWGLTGYAGIFSAMGLGLLFGAVAGYGYGILLNRVKGGEMMIATYVGFSAVAFMSMLWLFLPFKSPVVNFGMGGQGGGLRTSISVGEFWDKQLSAFLGIDGRTLSDSMNLSTEMLNNFYLPTGMLLFFFLMCFFVWLFFESKTGQAMSAVGQNPDFAEASGINVNKMRLISVVLSTMLGALGIIVYEQSFGFIQLYTAPLAMPFPAVAAVLLGGASINRATIFHVILGTFLYQGVVTITPSYFNSMGGEGDGLSEVFRVVISNGLIVYALAQRGKGVRQ